MYCPLGFLNDEVLRRLQAPTSWHEAEVAFHVLESIAPAVTGGSPILAALLDVSVAYLATRDGINAHAIDNAAVHLIPRSHSSGTRARRRACPVLVSCRSCS